MSARYTEKQVVLAVRRLTKSRLRTFVRAECVRPVETADGIAFTDADLARLELLCELAEDFDLDEDALAVVLSLIDQLHGVRRELRGLARALAEEPPEVQERVRQAWLRATGR
ncbi:MAG TPA: chaperone modulator CbpM [Thermohalobaculum sp.]|nr:chaperone modulator CbpM [Thermohalobaculum sp.]